MPSCLKNPAKKRVQERVEVSCKVDNFFWDTLYNSPKWSPATLDEITEEVVDRYFSSLGEEELRL